MRSPTQRGNLTQLYEILSTNQAQEQNNHQADDITHAAPLNVHMPKRLCACKGKPQGASYLAEFPREEITLALEQGLDWFSKSCNLDGDVFPSPAEENGHCKLFMEEGLYDRFKILDAEIPGCSQSPKTNVGWQNIAPVSYLGLTEGRSHVSGDCGTI